MPCPIPATLFTQARYTLIRLGLPLSECDRLTLREVFTLGELSYWGSLSQEEREREVSAQRAAEAKLDKLDRETVVQILTNPDRATRV